MTATLVAGLIEEGKLNWTTTVGEIFGDVVPDINPAWKPVTIAQLLTHRGRSPGEPDAGGLWSRLRERNGTPAEQRLQLVSGVITHPPAAAPATTYLYSNADLRSPARWRKKSPGAHGRI